MRAALQSIHYAGGVHVELSRHSHDAVATARGALAFLRGAEASGPLCNKSTPLGE